MPEESNKKETQPPSSKVSKKRKSAREEEDILACVLNVMKNPPPVPLPNNNAIDDNDLFGQVVGSHMKRIPDGHSKEMLKLKIQQLLVEEEFKGDQSVWPRQFATLIPSTSADRFTY